MFGFAAAVGLEGGDVFGVLGGERFREVLICGECPACRSLATHRRSRIGRDMAPARYKPFWLEFTLLVEC